jgi:hypothetical protein
MLAVRRVRVYEVTRTRSSIVARHARGTRHARHAYARDASAAAPRAAVARIDASTR